MTLDKNNGLKLAFVVPRFEPDSAGGAEVHAMLLAQKLQQRGHNITILTTCARDHFTWDNFFPEGEERIGTLNVHRFPINENRDRERMLELQDRIVACEELSFEEEKNWISEGAVSEKLFKYIHDHSDEFDCFVFIPYMFGTTYWGGQIVPKKSVLIPCLHDETYAYLKIFRELFDNVQGVIPSTEEEIELAKELYDLPDYKVARVAMGFEAAEEYNPERFRKKFKIKGPFVLYAGRRESGKNTDLLIEYFRTRSRQADDGLKLVLIGSGEVELNPIDRKHIIDLGYVDEQDKIDAHSAATIFCQPSINESLSIVIMESWLAGTPVLVHSKCKVTSGHCLRSNGGLMFGDFYQFNEILDLLMEQPQLLPTMAENGRNYVQTEYNWNTVIDRFESAMKKFGFI
jgi:glycosyltransferase involved in cell wall biosynthesis